MSYHHHGRSSSLLPTESHHSSGFTPSMQRLMDKQREYEAFYKIHQQSQQLLDFLGQFSDQYDVLDGGSEAVGDVVEHWQTAFRATHLALASLEQQRKEAETNQTSTQNLLPERLVRIPVATSNSDHSPAPYDHGTAKTNSSSLEPGSA